MMKAASSAHDRGAQATGNTVRVLEADLELGLRVPANRITRAREQLAAPLRVLEPGLWQMPEIDDRRGHMGYLVMEGLLARELALAGNVCTELIGEGDIVHPLVPIREERLIHYRVSWNVLERARIAELDERFAARLVEWPQVTTALLERSIRRTHRMSVHQALLQLSPVETRLLVLFWHLAERWGRVTPAGIVLRLRLSHEQLGRLVGCQRPSVTTALKEVAASGLAVRRTDGTWLLRGSPPSELSELRWHRHWQESQLRSVAAPVGR